LKVKYFNCILAMHLSSGVLTARGGMTSHAAVVARGMGKVKLLYLSNKSVVFVDGAIYKLLMKSIKN
jgi:phosphoenolpyruvate synthase/pyruvate phosphate dikinase